MKNLNIKATVIAALALVMFMFPHFSRANTRNINIPTEGQSDIGGSLYPIYVIKGEINSYSFTTYNSVGKLVTLSPIDLASSSMKFVDKRHAKDKKLLNCGLVCKDNNGRIVGLNPTFKYLKK